MEIFGLQTGGSVAEYLYTVCEFAYTGGWRCVCFVCLTVLYTGDDGKGTTYFSFKRAVCYNVRHPEEAGVNIS